MDGRSQNTVLIIGGGIGGLALGAALRRVGIPAPIFERASQLAEVGAGLTLWSNAVKALRHLGVEEAILRHGAVIERAQTVTVNGEGLSELSVGDISRRAGAASLCVARADLQRVLAQALEPNLLHLNATCVGFDCDAEGVTAHFADGWAERGALLIGADGINSLVRERLFGKEPPRCAGYCAYRGIAQCQPPHLPEGTIMFGLGRGTQIGIQRCGGGRIYWFATMNAPAGSAGRFAGNKRQALEAFRSWFPLVQTVLEATDEAAILCNEVVDRPPRWPWGRGPVTLLGDAAHPTTPNLGQGACQALEGAVVLADVLRRNGVRAESLRVYENKRRKRTAMVTRESRSLGKTFQWENRLAVWLRGLALRSKSGQRQGVRLFETLLIHETPDLPAVPVRTH